MAKEITLAPLSEKSWQELRDLAVKCGFEPGEETYEEYLENHRKYPPKMIFG